MKAISYLFTVILGAATIGVVFAHGGGGGTATYEADTPKLDFRKHSSFFDISDDNAEPLMKMSVIDQTIRVTFRDAEGKSVNVDERAEAKVFISSGGKTTIIHLLPIFGGALSGDGDFIAEPGMRVDLTLRLVGQRPINQTFYPMR